MFVCLTAYFFYEVHEIISLQKSWTGEKVDCCLILLWSIQRNPVQFRSPENSGGQKHWSHAESQIVKYGDNNYAYIVTLTVDSEHISPM
jgi:hypothetical protein